MRRREFITLLGGAAAWPLAVRAQQPDRVPRRNARVGILNYADAQDTNVNKFRNGLRELGYVEGQNLAITYRWADGHLDHLPEMAAELVASGVDVIVAIGPAVRAAKRTTTTVPIVIAFSGDPVGNGVVSNLARPGGNITGFSYMSTDLAAKRLELLTQAFSNTARIAVLYNPGEPATALEMQQTEAAARAIGVTSAAFVGQPRSRAAFAALCRERPTPCFSTGCCVNRHRIIELAARQRLPAMYGWRDFVNDGRLMSYGPNIRLIIRRAAIYVDRIVKGEKPGDLPVEQPARLELILNLKTARALGLEVPDRLLARADEVIE